MAYNKKFYENKEELDKWRNIKRRGKSVYRERTGSFKYPSRRWTDYEIKLVLEHNDTDRVLSKHIGRSVTAIQSMRSKLKRAIKNETR